MIRETLRDDSETRVGDSSSLILTSERVWCELTYTARKRNQQESGREQDSRRTRNQDLVTPAASRIPIEMV